MSDLPPSIRAKAVDNLCTYVKEVFGNKPCPCCARAMRFEWPERRGLRTPRDAATRGHLASKQTPHSRSLWYFQCHQCNNDQAHLDLFAWSRKLANDADPRAERVVLLSQYVSYWLTRKEIRYPT